jgi:hypothetical protein
MQWMRKGQTLSDSCEFNRQSIIDKFPWIAQRGHPMIVGNDIDALMSSFLLHHYLGWKLIGFYNYETIWYEEIYKMKDLENAI